MTSAIKLANLFPSAFIYENTAAAVFYAVNSKLEKDFNKNLLFINIGSGGIKLSIVNIYVNEEEVPVVKNLIDKFYYQFSGYQIDHCFGSIILDDK